MKTNSILNRTQLNALYSSLQSYRRGNEATVFSIRSTKEQLVRGDISSVSELLSMTTQNTISVEQKEGERCRKTYYLDPQLRGELQESPLISILNRATTEFGFCKIANFETNFEIQA